MKVNDIVRLVEYPVGHVNEKARVVEVNKEGIVVSNMNMPFMGTLANKQIPFGMWVKI
jgi:hypothetical protein